jgi:hypothetical protein
LFNLPRTTHPLALSRMSRTSAGCVNITTSNLHTFNAAQIGGFGENESV